MSSTNQILPVPGLNLKSPVPSVFRYQTRGYLSREESDRTRDMHKVRAAKALRPRVIFSGIQPTGIPHLGNYAGALRQWVQLQAKEPSETKLIYSIVDLHAITTPQRPEQLKQWKREALAALLAIGIDPDRATLFSQSSVRATIYT